MEFKHIETEYTKRFLRFSELYDLYYKVDGRRQMTFEDKGYVDNVELFLTCCLSTFKLFFTLDSSTINWELLTNAKQFKTLLDFYEDKITCQGKLLSEMPKYFKARIWDLEIEAFVVIAFSVEEREKIKEFFKL